MNRRGFIAAGGAACCALAAASAGAQDAWLAPARFSRPDLSTDEGGLWAMMDREERNLRRSPFVIRDRALNEYVQGIACRLAGDHCPDMRVHIVNTPLFNASMAPNGMMQVWSGLLLRVENEAQLAAVIGHEIGHYLEKHSLERLRDARSASAFAQFIGLFGLVGALGQLAVLAGMFSFSRDQERRADVIGATLMHRAGYDTGEAAKIWSNLLLELKARPDGDPALKSPMFATHPPADERSDTLARLAATLGGGATNADVWEQKIRPFRREWLLEEIKRGQHEESLALLDRMSGGSTAVPDYRYARGEVYRLRAKEGDLDLALEDFRAAAALGGEPPETHRALGLIYRIRRQPAEAKASFLRYLDMAPAAPDQAMIKSYMEELGS
ncbi:MAG: M48 family metalloprotease [Burkholderiales bacterium]|nr:M48 family metalloprotease [Burkholderiales bacterium]